MQQAVNKTALDHPDSAIAIHKFKTPLKKRIIYRLSAIKDADVCKYGAAWWACIAVLSVVAAGVIVVGA